MQAPLSTRHFQVGETKNVLDDAIDRHAEAYLSAYPEIMEFSSFERSGTFNFYIGMIWTNDCQKPDERQLRVRGSSSLTTNKIVELDVSKIDDYQSFFPGQIVAFTAEPFQSSRLVVKKIFNPIGIAPKMKTLHNDDKINLLIAAGPFMHAEVEDWTLFDNLISSIKKNSATHVIILGPLVDMENKELRGKFDSSWQSIFAKLMGELHDKPVRVYIVPSTRDILPSSLNSNYFYPCAKLDFSQFSSKLRRPTKIKCTIESVSDPSQIDLGGVWLDVTSAEILFHMNKSTLHVNKKAGLKQFDSIYKHIISHGIYPLYPNPIDFAVDRVKLDQFVQLSRLGPHMIVLPTRFAPTITEIENRLVVCVPKCSVKKQAIFVQIPRIEEANRTTNNDQVQGDQVGVGEVKMELATTAGNLIDVECDGKSQFSRFKWRIETLGESKRLLEPKLEPEPEPKLEPGEGSALPADQADAGSELCEKPEVLGVPQSQTSTSTREPAIVESQ